jgi:glutathione S-transferase
MGNSPITYDITRNKYRFNNIRVISNRARTSTFQPAAGTKRRADAPVPRGKAMLTVHHLNNSRSQRVLWLLEELGVPYEIIRYQRQPDMRAPAELRAIHPLGKSPVITDNGNTVAESGAIVEYIVDTYGEGRLIPPPKTPERLRYTYWLHYAEGSAMSPLLLKLLFTLMPKRAPALLRPLVRKVSNQALTALVNPQLKQHMAYWEGELGKSQWFAGAEFTAADIQMSFPLEAAAARAGLDQGHPKAMAFLDRIHARPAYARALERGGPYTVGR